MMIGSRKGRGGEERKVTYEHVEDPEEVTLTWGFLIIFFPSFMETICWNGKQMCYKGFRMIFNQVMLPLKQSTSKSSTLCL